MNEKLIAYARLVAIAASQQQLSDEVAQLFCKDAVPQLLAEIEVLSRVSARFEGALALTLPQPEPAPVVAPPKPARKARKARKKKARAK